jgi:hypothetical protein
MSRGGRTARRGPMPNWPLRGFASAASASPVSCGPRSRRASAGGSFERRSATRSCGQPRISSIASSPPPDPISCGSGTSPTRPTRGNPPHLARLFEGFAACLAAERQRRPGTLATYQWCFADFRRFAEGTQPSSDGRALYEDDGLGDRMAKACGDSFRRVRGVGSTPLLPNA